MNVSARQFRHADFVSQVQAALERTGADPQRLKLELTESQLVDNVEETIDKMQALRSLGVSASRSMISVPAIHRCLISSVCHWHSSRSIPSFRA